MKTIGQVQKFIARVRQSNHKAFDMCDPDDIESLNSMEGAEEAYKRIADYIRGPGKPPGMGSAPAATRKRVSSAGGRAKWAKR